MKDITLTDKPECLCGAEMKPHLTVGSIEIHGYATDATFKLCPLCMHKMMSFVGHLKAKTSPLALLNPF